MMPRLPTPKSARGIATTCASASALIAAGVVPWAAYFWLNADIPIEKLFLSPIPITLGGLLHYLAACGAIRHRKPKKKTAGP